MLMKKKRRWTLPSILKSAITISLRLNKSPSGRTVSKAVQKIFHRQAEREIKAKCGVSLRSDQIYHAWEAVIDPLPQIIQIPDPVAFRNEQSLSVRGALGDPYLVPGILSPAKQNQDEQIPCILESDESSKERRKNWARLIQKIYEVDPLTCPKCSGKMKVISVIEEQDVIKKILKHLGLWEVKPRPPPRNAKSQPLSTEPHIDYSGSQIPKQSAPLELTGSVLAKQGGIA
jgi:hypothetical protein